MLVRRRFAGAVERRAGGEAQLPPTEVSITVRALVGWWPSKCPSSAGPWVRVGRVWLAPGPGQRTNARRQPDLEVTVKQHVCVVLGFVAAAFVAVAVASIQAQGQPEPLWAYAYSEQPKAGD